MLKHLGLVFCATALVAAPARASTIVRFDFDVRVQNTSSVVVRLYDGVSPNSVANFLNYVTTDRYDGTFIHRSVPNFVVQGGGFDLNGSIHDAAGIVTDPPIADEFGVSNRRGTLAFAKNSLGATSQWFFNVVDNVFLDDQDFTVIGRVLAGFELIDAINSAPLADFANAEDQPGEDFDQVPVVNLATVNANNDITPSDAIVLRNVAVLDLLDGDFNGDGTVDAADYTVWRDTLGSTLIASADGNGDGVVNQADYDLWLSSFGASSSLVAVAVPEPTSFLLLVGSMGFTVPGRRRA